MTSIIDQYEQESQISRRLPPISDPMTSSGYINIEAEDNRPMFSKQKMNLKPSDLITHVAVNSDFLILAMANGKLFRLDLKCPDQNEEIQFSKYVPSNAKLTGIYLDPLGYHLLMSFASKTKDGNSELLYSNRKSLKIKSVSKFKNYEITEVGWNYQNISEVNTGPILLGTSRGYILETELENDNDKIFSSSQQYCKQIFEVSRGTDVQPITGIQFHKVDKKAKYVIFVTTPKRLYRFIGQAVFADGKPSLQSIFQAYLNMPETGFQDIPSGLNYSKLQFYYDQDLMPKTFAWLTEPGIFYGYLNPECLQNSNSLLTQKELINYPDSKESANNTPITFVLTEFHALLMYPDKVKAVSLLNHELIYEDFYSEAHGRLKDIVKDHKRRTIWAVTDKCVFRYKIIREERDVWRIYCDKEQFDLAKQYCHGNQAFLDTVGIKQAEVLFSKKNYEASAEAYATTQNSFEHVCLKFLEIDQTEALKVYLNKRLESLKEDDTILITITLVWIVELFLQDISSLRLKGEVDTIDYKRLQSDFEKFLNQPKVKKAMPHIKSVVYDLMLSHGDKHNLIKLMLTNEDHENVIAQQIYNEDHTEALKTLQSLKRADLYYQYIEDLLIACPKPTVNVLISEGARLSPLKLLPAFLSCKHDAEHTEEIMRYLEFMVQNFNVKDRPVHNYLLTLYAENDAEALMRYLTRQGQDATMVNYDIHYALRLCKEKDLRQACVKLSALLELWEAAIELALDLDLALAKSVADMPEDSEIQRQLWLNIAEHVITKHQDIKEAMSFLEECPLIKIEDILPFFGDVVTIDHFREPICQSLQEYNNQIEELKVEMEEAARSAEYVRGEIQSFRGRSAVVSATEACALCHLALMLRPFYLFPCAHKFHSDCLMLEAQPALSPARRNRLTDLQRQLNSLPSSDLTRTTSSGLQYKEVLKNEIDDIVASECIFCGEYMLNSIDKPFISDEDWDKEIKEWE